MNSIFNKGRDLNWLDAANNIVDIMLTSICECRSKSAERDGSELVPTLAQILKQSWDIPAFMTVDKFLGIGYSNFKVAELASIGGQQDDEENVERLTRYGDHQNRILME